MILLLLSWSQVLRICRLKLSAQNHRLSLVLHLRPSSPTEVSVYASSADYLKPLVRHIRSHRSCNVLYLELLNVLLYAFWNAKVPCLWVASLQAEADIIVMLNTALLTGYFSTWTQASQTTHTNRNSRLNAPNFPLFLGHSATLFVCFYKKKFISSNFFLSIIFSSPAISENIIRI